MDERAVQPDTGENRLGGWVVWVIWAGANALSVGFTLSVSLMLAGSMQKDAQGILDSGMALSVSGVGLTWVNIAIAGLGITLVTSTVQWLVLNAYVVRISWLGWVIPTFLTYVASLLIALFVAAGMFVVVITLGALVSLSPSSDYSMIALALVIVDCVLALAVGAGGGALVGFVQSWALRRNNIHEQNWVWLCVLAGVVSQVLVMVGLAAGNSLGMVTLGLNIVAGWLLMVAAGGVVTGYAFRKILQPQAETSV
jgi:hypothetical protein